MVQLVRSKLLFHCVSFVHLSVCMCGLCMSISVYVYVCLQVGALSALSSGETNPHDGNLTFLGRVISTLPVDIRLGKLMLLGHVFGVLDDTIMISAYSLSLLMTSPVTQLQTTQSHTYTHTLSLS